RAGPPAWRSGCDLAASFVASHRHPFLVMRLRTRMREAQIGDVGGVSTFGLVKSVRLLMGQASAPAKTLRQARRPAPPWKPAWSLANPELTHPVGGSSSILAGSREDRMKDSQVCWKSPVRAPERGLSA